MFKQIITAASLLGSVALSSNVSAVGVDFDLTSPNLSAGFHNGYYSNQLTYLADIELNVTGWSYESGMSPGHLKCYGYFGCHYTPGTEVVTNVVESADVGDFFDYGLGVEEAWSPDHAVDNRIGDYDMLLLTFSEAVSLDSVSANWRGTQYSGHNDVKTNDNGDISVMAYLGGSDNPSASFAGDTWESLLAEDWTTAGEHQLGYGNSTAVNVGGLVSKYWLVGAYNNNLTAGDIGFSEHDDFFKLSGVSVSVNPVPVPSSMLLFGAGLIGFGAIRRRKKA